MSWLPEGPEREHGPQPGTFLPRGVGSCTQALMGPFMVLLVL